MKKIKPPLASEVAPGEIEPSTLRGILLWCGAKYPDDKFLQDGLERMIRNFPAPTEPQGAEAPTENELIDEAIAQEFRSAIGLSEKGNELALAWLHEKFGVKQCGAVLDSVNLIFTIIDGKKAGGRLVDREGKSWRLSEALAAYAAAAPRPQEPLKADNLFGVYCAGNPESVPTNGRFIYWDGWQRLADWLNARFFSPAQSPQWISVEDSLPRAGIFVHLLVHGVVQKMPAKLYPMGYAGCDGNEWRWLEESYDPMPFEEASHWQPLPEPPAQSQGAAFVQPPTAGDPSCHKCGAPMVRDGSATNNEFECLSCGATTSCAEGAASEAKTWRQKAHDLEAEYYGTEGDEK